MESNHLGGVRGEGVQKLTHTFCMVPVTLILTAIFNYFPFCSDSELCLRSLMVMSSFYVCDAIAERTVAHVEMD